MRSRHQAAILGLALLLSGCGPSTPTAQTAVSTPTSTPAPVGSSAGTPSLAAPTPAPTPTPTATPAPTPSLPPSPITVASVLKDFNAALPAFNTFPLPKIPSLKKYAPAPSVAKLRAWFAALPSSSPWQAGPDKRYEGVNTLALANCTNGKFAQSDTTLAYNDVVGGCSALLSSAVAMAEQTRDPAAIVFAKGIVAYVAYLAQQVPGHGQELLNLCVQTLQVLG